MNRGNSLVSVIMPAYNASRYIEESIQSVLKQTYKNIELLCVDDKSSDDTYKVIRSLAMQDARVKALQVDKNGGPAQARNLALLKASGRYIAFCDSDDLWLSRKLEKQIDDLVCEDAGLSYAGYRRISESGDYTGKVIEVPRHTTYSKLLRNTVILTSSVVIDKQKCGEFLMTQTFYDDFVLWLELLKKGVSAVGLNEPLVRYRVISNSYSRNKWISAKNVWRTYRDIERLSVISATISFIAYSWNGWKKYREF